MYQRKHPEFSTAADYVELSYEARRRLQEMAADIDRAGEYPEAAMSLLEQMGFYDLSVPRSLGGVAADDAHEDAVAIARILTNIAAGESSTAQIWEFSRLMALEALGPTSHLSEAAKNEIQGRMAERPIRFCGTAAERYKKRFSYQMAIKPVEGGVLVNGTKYFATGVDGADYAMAPGCLEGFPSFEEGGAHEVLIDLRSEGVHIHHDWDNMGQRATGSGAVTYEDVFVPDGFHWSRTVAQSTASPIGQAGLTCVLLGIGLGAVDALTHFVQHRESYPDAPRDPVIQFQLGEYLYRMKAAELAVERSVELAVGHDVSGSPNLIEAIVAAHSAKLSLVDALMRVTSTMHNLCGGQSTAHLYDLDRFWRNARTLASQDVLDLKQKGIAAWELLGEPPQGAR
ncbi:acyl-CoA dehydrogenase family protein [Microbacterium sp.]|uniref:acyl-CoA dehydrogenase family protein n=1 Tax=Microbacterium sp. TaxID=51671 RepID=UPI0039E2C124